VRDVWQVKSFHPISAKASPIHFAYTYCELRVNNINIHGRICIYSLLGLERKK
jgi:hypothetical protein